MPTNYPSTRARQDGVTQRQKGSPSDPALPVAYADTDLLGLGAPPACGGRRSPSGDRRRPIQYWLAADLDVGETRHGDAGLVEHGLDGLLVVLD